MALFRGFHLSWIAMEGAPGLGEGVQRLQILQERLKLVEGDHIGTI